MSPHEQRQWGKGDNMQDKGKFIFVTGSARSGKSFFAEKLAVKLGGKVSYIATCVPGDEEMRIRVAQHQARRPAEWLTVEEAFDPARVIKELDQPGHVFLLDCMTLLVSNLLLRTDMPLDEEQILARISELARVSSESMASVIIVSNEVGGGIVPADSLSRSYRDILGWANQVLASYADEAYITIAGIPVELKALTKGI